jgi:thioredoxin reductase (NADPH)
MAKTDVVIIGAGPAGLTAALYLARSAYAAVVLEKGAPGGKLLTIPVIENYPGLPATSGMALAQSFLDSAAHFGVTPTYGNVRSVSKTPEGLFLTSTDAGDFLSRAVLVASGLANVPSVPGEKALLGKGVSYCATCDGRFYKGKDIAVYGNGEKTVSEALYLAPLVGSLLFLVKGDLDCSEASKAALKSFPNIQILENAVLTAITGESHVEKILYSVGDFPGEKSVSGVFPLAGEKSASAFLSPLPLLLDHGFIVTDASLMSNVPGLFAAGDIVKKPLRQVVTAAGDGALSSNSIIAYLRKGAGV